MPRRSCVRSAHRSLRGSLLPLVLASILGWALPAQDVAPVATNPSCNLDIVGGAYVIRGELQAKGTKIEVHLVLDLGRGGGMDLHGTTAGVFELKRGEVVDFLAGPLRLENIAPAISRLRDLERITRDYDVQLSQVPVVGILGAAELLRGRPGARLKLDPARKRLEILPPSGSAAPVTAHPPQARHRTAAVGATTVVATDASVSDRPVVSLVGASARLAAGFDTGKIDSKVHPSIVRRLEAHPGQLGAVGLGPLDVDAYVAVRPDPGVREGGAKLDVVLGTRFLAPFEVVWDPTRHRLSLTATAEPESPKIDRAGIEALAGDRTEDLASFAETHPDHRYAQEAADRFLRMAFESHLMYPEDLRRAVALRARAEPERRRARWVIDILNTLRRRAPAAYGSIRGEAVEIALAAAGADEDAESVHKIRSEIGAVLLEQGEVDAAYRHLLGAAFGLPYDGLISLRLGQVLEKRGKLDRARWKYLGAAITEEAGAEGIKALKRLDREAGGSSMMEVDTLRQELEGRVPAFEPASRYRPKEGAKPNRSVLVETFTSANAKPTLGADLAVQGLLAHFAGGEVVILNHHVFGRQPDPLSSPASLDRARELGVRGGPAVLLDGVEQVPRVGGRDIASASPSFRKLRDAIESRLVERADHQLKLEASLEKGLLTGKATVTGPATRGLAVQLWLVERTVLYPGASTLVFHEWVVRGELTAGRVSLKNTEDPREVSAGVDLSDASLALEDLLDTVEEQSGSPFGMRPTALAPDQMAVVATLRGPGGSVINSAVYELKPRPSEEDDR